LLLIEIMGRLVNQLIALIGDTTALTRARQKRPKTQQHTTQKQDAGAVIHCKTNVPQMLMLPETTNNIFGTTHNAWDASRCAGGSSGGEGALIGVRGSLLGIGTDIGGSIRIPAQFNGITGFKPTPWRVSEQGITLPFLVEDRSGMQAVKLTAGPLALYVEDLVLMLK
jgi:Asp-tRNA(Asn)/Glu-tRNA(Gln) amidotransferase A subunit family amidase